MSLKEKAKISEPVYEIKEQRDIYIPMRDGVRLAADIYRPDNEGKFPALLALAPYGKELQRLQFTFPPQARPSHLWDGCIEAGNTSYIVPRGYVHVVADIRGTGYSEGKYAGFMDIGGGKIGEDGYDLVEWIARQPWCNGNVGMAGVSYYASAQVLVAGEQPPSLKAIFPIGGHYDVYTMNYHGGILWLMPRAAMEGRGGDSGIARNNVHSAMMDKLSEEEFERIVQERLNDPDIMSYPNLYHLLKYPQGREVFLDIVLNPLNGPFYTENQPASRFAKINIPVYTGNNWGRPWSVRDSIDCYNEVKGPKKITFQPSPPMQERPYHELHDLMIRWYDYWLKGIDNGIMDEPPITIFMEGSNEWRHVEEWPPAAVNLTKFYLRTHEKLSLDPESFNTEVVPPDGFYQAPLTVSDNVQSVTYKTSPLLEEIEVAGDTALNIFAAIDNEDTNWMVKLYDVEPSGKKVLFSTGWLKATHREIDENKSTPGHPYHPHTKAEPVKPHEIYEYQIYTGPVARVFKKGHYIEIVIKNIESPFEPELALLPPDGFHLNTSRPVTHKIYRDKNYPSHLILPIVSKNS